jgi:hypothetical protein
VSPIAACGKCVDGVIECPDCWRGATEGKAPHCHMKAAKQTRCECVCHENDPPSFVECDHCDGAEEVRHP